jgi:hypothetical protein
MSRHAGIQLLFVLIINVAWPSGSLGYIHRVHFFLSSDIRSINFFLHLFSYVFIILSVLLPSLFTAHFSHTLFNNNMDTSSQLTFNFTELSRYSAGLRAGWSVVRILIEAGNFSHHHRVQTVSGAHPASHPMGIKGSFPGVKAGGVWSWPLTSV